jgi:hypothetical protein
MTDNMPPPRLVRGKPPEHWLESERRDAWLWNLGPRFRTPGMKPPPVAEYALPPVPGSASDCDRACQGSMVDWELPR